jgi:hypothetical protein
MPEPYAPPVQRQPFESFQATRTAHIVNMSDPDAAAYFVQDISGALEGNWRWTQQRPTIRVRARSNENLKYVIDFTLPDATFRDTGPVNLSFYVNDRLLDRVQYKASGQLHFEKPVPPEWVTPEQDATVAAEIDKVWVSKEDGARLGFILTRIGIAP